MVEIGKYNRLRVRTKEPHGFYLQGDKVWGDILLPNKHAPEGLKINDEIDVFVYFDSEDVIIATTRKPLATVGEFATLKVAAIEEFGIFLDWGLERDLFVPFREQLFKMVPGESYVVYLYVDSSNRIAASTRLTKFIDKSPSPFSEGQQVELRLCQVTDLGIKAIVNGTHYGLIYKDDIINNLKLGQVVKGFVKKSRDDGKIDLSLRPVSADGGGDSRGDQRADLAEVIVERLKQAGGFLPVNSKSSADEINSMFKVSRNKFKVAIGHLYKKRIISTDEAGIRLIE